MLSELEKMLKKAKTKEEIATAFAKTRDEYPTQTKQWDEEVNAAFKKSGYIEASDALQQKHSKYPFYIKINVPIAVILILLVICGLYYIYVASGQTYSDKYIDFSAITYLKGIGIILTGFIILVVLDIFTV
jgi:hypothetical protein